MHLLTSPRSLFLMKPTGSLITGTVTFFSLSCLRNLQQDLYDSDNHHDYSIISEIYRSHQRLVNRVHFKELTRVKGGTVCG
jgi:hypothetical protein